MDDMYMDLATDARAYVFENAQAWLRKQIESDPNRLVRELAQMLVGTPCPDDPRFDYRLEDVCAVDAFRGRYTDDIRAEPETAAMAQAARDDDEQEVA